MRGARGVVRVRAPQSYYFYYLRELKLQIIEIMYRKKKKYILDGKKFMWQNTETSFCDRNKCMLQKQVSSTTTCFCQRNSTCLGRFRCFLLQQIIMHSHRNFQERRQR